MKYYSVSKHKNGDGVKFDAVSGKFNVDLQHLTVKIMQ
jgi:hypothetical protein